MRAAMACLAVLVLCPVAVRAAEDPPAAKDWVKGLRAGDEDAVAHLWGAAGADERDLLEEGLKHKDAKVRMTAVWRVSDLGLRWPVDRLRALASDRNPGVAVAARLALVHLGMAGGERAWRTLVYPGADLDKAESRGGATEWTLLSKDGTRTVSGYYERAIRDQGWGRLRDLSAAELPERCRGPWSGLFGKGPVTFRVSVCGGPAPGDQAVIRLSVRDSFAPKVMGRALDKDLKAPGVR